MTKQSLVVRMPICLLLVASTLAGCASPKIFQEPDGQHVAKLRIRNADVGGYYMHVISADPVDCTFGGNVGWLSGGKTIDSRRVGMLDSEDIKEGIIERTIPVARPITFIPYVVARLDWFTRMTVMGASQEASRERARTAQAGICSTPAFTPKEGEEYELTYSPSPGACNVTLVQLKLGADGQVIRSDITGDSRRAMSAIPNWNGIPEPTCRDL